MKKQRISIKEFTISLFQIQYKQKLKGEVSPLIQYLGKVLPLAIMTTLVLYCLRTTSFNLIENFI